MTSYFHSRFVLISRYRISGRLPPTSLQHQSMNLPTRPVGALGWLLSLFITVSSVAMLTVFSAANAESVSCNVPDIRLYGGKTNYDGGLFVKAVDGNWQRLCLQWDYAGLQFKDLGGPVRIAHVICRSLGFRSEKASAIFYEYHPEQLPSSSTDFVTTVSLRCQGNENQISECHPLFREVNISRLKFNDSDTKCFSGIACGDDPEFAITLNTPYNLPQHVISFINETSSENASGVLDATAFGLKGSVCADLFQTDNHARIAKVACREIGLRAKANFQGVALAYERFGEWNNRGISLLRKTSCFMPNTTCTGRERSIADCNHGKLWGSTESSLDRFYDWYGQPVSVACLMKSSDGLQLTTGQQLFNRSTARDGVFIKYGSEWLPVTSSSDPHSCRAICNGLHKEGPSTAICRAERINMSLLSEGSGFVAFIYCHPDETDVNHCAHFVKQMSAVTDREMFGFYLQHVQARCMPLRANSTSDFRLAVTEFDSHGYRGNVRTGCLVFSAEGQGMHLAAALTSEDAQSVAQLTCRRIYPNGETYASYLSFNDIAVTTGWTNQRGPICQLASAYFGCQPNARSPNECAVHIAGYRTRPRRALGIICAPAIKDVIIYVASSVHENDGVMQLALGPYPAFVSIDGWSDVMASVACREQGFNDTVAHRAIRKAKFLRSQEWLLSNVNCTGSENALLECKHEWRVVSLPFGSYVAGISCGRDGSKVRIVPFSNRSNSGFAAIEAFLGNTTERFYFCSVSDSRFAKSQSEIISTETASGIAFCRAAGYPRTKNAERLILSENDMPETSGFNMVGVYAFRNFICHDKDSPLEECSYEEIGRIERCPKPELASSTRSLVLALRCDEYEFGTMVRLVGGATPYEGHVEVMYKGEWGAVCDDRFDVDASTVVCRQLFGPKSQGKPVPGSRFVTKNEKYLLDDVRCSPTDKSLADCAHNVWGEHDCGPCKQIGVICSKVNYIRQPIATIKTEGGRQQLVCAAEGQPMPSYQWFTTGVPLMVASDRVDVVCQELDTVQYTCNAFNDAGEGFVQVVLDKKNICDNATVGKDNLSTSNSLMITGTGVGIGILLLLLLGAIWKILALRKALQEARQHDGIDQQKMSYTVLHESPSN